MTESRVKRIRARWEAFQPTRAGSFWAVVYTVAGTLALGFTAGGWMTAGGAQEMADKAASKARAELAGRYCVERFLAGADAEARLASLKGIDYDYKRSQSIEQGGWAMVPGDPPASRQAAKLCAAALNKHTGTVAAS